MSSSIETQKVAPVVAAQVDHPPSRDLLSSIVERTWVDRSSLQWIGARGLTIMDRPVLHRSSSVPAMNDQSREIQLLSLARDGDGAGLLELAYDDPAGDPDEMAYKWLNVAADFGHDEAEDMVDAFHQGPLHADDDNLVSGHAHFELAVAYLTGRDGLPVDFGKARGHVKEMAVRHYPYTVQDGKGMLAEARRGMSPEARAVFDAALAGTNNPDVEGADAEEQTAIRRITVVGRYPTPGPRAGRLFAAEERADAAPVSVRLMAS